MHYVLNFFDIERRESHCVHMNCKDDRGAMALVEQFSPPHEMELRQGSRIVKGYKGRFLPVRARASRMFIH